MYVCVCTYAYINMQIYTNAYRIRIRSRIRIRDRIRNSLKSRIRIRDRIRKKSFRIHNTASKSRKQKNLGKRKFCVALLSGLVHKQRNYSQTTYNNSVNEKKTITIPKLLHFTCVKKRQQNQALACFFLKPSRNQEKKSANTQNP